MTASTPSRPDLAGVFDQHQYAEFVLHDASKALETMVAEPSVRLMPTQAGGDGRAAVYGFYSREFIPSLPPDLQVTLVSRTVGADRLVDERSSVVITSMPIALGRAGERHREEVGDAENRPAAHRDQAGPARCWGLYAILHR
jgi:hypothetical protein